MNEFININKITEVIFCAKDISAQNIIYSMAVVNSKKNIDFKIIPEKTQFIIGSQSIYTNDTYFTTELKHINSIENIHINFIPKNTSIGLISLVIYLAIFASIGTIVCLNFASSRLPGTNVMAYSLLIPFWVLSIFGFSFMRGRVSGLWLYRAIR